MTALTTKVAREPNRIDRRVRWTSAEPSPLTSLAPDQPVTARPARTLGRKEFAAMLAATMAMTALAIDVMLPAFGDIRAEMGLAPDSSAVSGLVTAFFLGLAVAQIPAGLLADRYGRKPVLRIGLLLYAAGAIGTLLAPSLGWMLAARFVWGLAAGGPRVVTMAIVRDRYSGDQMARVMSVVMAMFILVPVIAPTIGSALLAIGTWQFVFAFCAVAATALNIWSGRPEETLQPEHRRPLRLGPVLEGARQVLHSRETVLLGLALTAILASFMSYIASIELIVDEVLGLGDVFPLIFGLLAIGMGIATFTNGRVIERVGMWAMLRGVLVAYVLVTTLNLAVSIVTDGTPPAWAFLPVIACVLASHALLVPNLNAAAMQPVGRVAGMASALLGAVSMAVGAIVGSMIDRNFDGTVGPLSRAFFISGVLAVVCFAIAHGRSRAPVPRG